MKKILLFAFTLLICFAASAQVNKKFGKITATKRIVTPVIQGMSDTTFGVSYYNCSMNGNAVSISDADVCVDIYVGQMFMIKDASCNEVIYTVLYCNYMVGHTLLEFDTDPPPDLLSGFTIAELLHIPELKIKNVKKFKSDTTIVRNHFEFAQRPNATSVRMFVSGDISGFILSNDRGDIYYVFPNTTGDGWSFSAIKP